MPNYLVGLNDRYPRGEVEPSYLAALQLTAASRVHGMLIRGIEPPTQLVDLVPDR